MTLQTKETTTLAPALNLVFEICLDEPIFPFFEGVNVNSTITVFLDYRQSVLVIAFTLVCVLY